MYRENAVTEAPRRRLDPNDVARPSTQEGLADRALVGDAIQLRLCLMGADNRHLPAGLLAQLLERDDAARVDPVTDGSPCIQSAVSHLQGHLASSSLRSLNESTASGVPDSHAPQRLNHICS